MLTLSAAARETGLTKAAISRAITTGRLSAKKMPSGSYEIDPAELFRVYPQSQPSQPIRYTSDNHQNLTVKPEVNPLLDALRQEREQLLNQIQDLRQRLDRESEERRAAQERLTALLTHQPQAKINLWWAARPWLWIVLVAVAIGAAVVRWVG
jgi:hypothetical protein